MSHELLRWLHVLAFALWFGTDLGVFTASLATTDPRQSVAVRSYAMRLLMTLDLVPRFAMLLVVAIGPLLAADWLGVAVPAWQAGGWCVLVAAWMLMEAKIHLATGAPSVWLVRTDTVLRVGLLLGCLVLASRPAITGSAPWLSVKLCLLATTVACGLGVRYTLAPFIPAFGQLVATGSTPEVEATLQRSMNQSRVLVLVIYACVLCAAWLGVAKPVWS
ncbi:MAG: hypothetical protein RJB26_57 [Pseudomonadota bacterium]|jgi:hypothetical protein